MTRTASACGKIILSGEYAVVFGCPGIAFPSLQRTVATLEDSTSTELTIRTSKNLDHPAWHEYIARIINLCEKQNGEKATGILDIHTTVPPGKGMGSSTSVVIALARCLLGEDCEEKARRIEDAMNPGNSGLDFAVVWQEKPLKFMKETAPEPLPIPAGVLSSAILINTGAPNETTTELVAWMKRRAHEPTISAALDVIGDCTERLLGGESPLSVFPDHHRAQVSLGVVPPPTQELITSIEQEGGAAKVIGAGGRTGGGGIVLALHPQTEILSSIAARFGFPVVP
jgi:mevalonate kinase